MTFAEMIYPLANASLLITSFALIVDDVWILPVAILDQQDMLVVHYMSIMPVVKYFIILRLTSLLNKPSVANKLLRKMLVMLVLKLKATTQTMVSLPRQNCVLTVKLNSRIYRLARCICSSSEQHCRTWYWDGLTLCPRHSHPLFALLA
jgi:hypothetical protein